VSADHNLGVERPLGVERSRGLNVLAVVGFVLSFIVTLAGVVLGIVALIQIRRTGERGKGLAIAAIILGGVLSVLLIVGSLGIIAGTVFIGQQNEAKDAAAQSDLGNAKIAMISYAVSNNGTYTDRVSDLAAMGFMPSTPSVRITIVDPNGGSTFCIEETSLANHTFHVTDSSEVESGPCAP
jgi:type IV pilus assembly protein PilA